MSLPVLRFSSRRASPLFLDDELPRFWTMWLGCPSSPGPETEKSLEGIVNGGKRLQTGSGSRLFRLGNQGQACWAPMMQARSCQESRFNESVRNACREAEASRAGGGSRSSGSGSDRIVVFHEQQVRLRFFRHQLSLAGQERLAVEIGS